MNQELSQGSPPQPNPPTDFYTQMPVPVPENAYIGGNGAGNYQNWAEKGVVPGAGGAEDGGPLPRADTNQELIPQQPPQPIAPAILYFSTDAELRAAWGAIYKGIKEGTAQMDIAEPLAEAIAAELRGRNLKRALG